MVFLYWVNSFYFRYVPVIAMKKTKENLKFQQTLMLKMMMMIMMMRLMMVVMTIMMMTITITIKINISALDGNYYLE